MIPFLQETFRRLLAEVQTDSHRYLFDHFHINSRLTGIVGPRGVGKTTLMLQYIKERLPKHTKCLYVSADSIYFSDHTLLAFVNDLYQEQGVDHFFIDEIHKYPNWNQELKNIYDAFPSVNVIFSGSSSIDLVKGSYDLSRRGKIFKMHGLSFREYLGFVNQHTYPVISYEDMIKNPLEATTRLAQIPQLKGHFKDFLQKGYYPFLFENPEDFYEKLLSVIDKSIYEDIAKFYNLKTPNLIYFKRILNFLASIPPGEININNLAKNLQVDHKTTEHYLIILSEAGLVRFVMAPDGGNRGLQKPFKIFINNTTLLSALNHYLGANISIGTVRELFFLQSLMNADQAIFYSAIGDYTVGNDCFEIGGKNKTRHQLKRATSGYLVKDDILHSGHQELPLYLFGFLY
jgi:predicted AAA+ superfamily ATPase